MEDLHPLVRAIIRGLSESPLYGLAEDVISRLSLAHDTPPGGRGGDDSPLGREGVAFRARRELTDDDGINQLLVVEEVVEGWLTRELAIAQALPKLARSLKLARVSFDRFRGVNLVDESRSLALKVFRKRFRLVVARARTALADDAGDLE